MSKRTRELTESVAERRAAHRPILIAIGPNGGSSALRAGRALAERHACDVAVISVVEPLPVYAFESGWPLMLPALLEQSLTDRRADIRARLRRLGVAPAPDRQLDVHVRYGVAADAIADVSRELDARLVVMGIGPHGHRHRLVATGSAGSTSRQVTCPVLAVAERAPDQVGCVVVATDFGAESIHAAKVALRLLAPRAVLHVVHAWSRVQMDFPNATLEACNTAYMSSLPGRFGAFRSALGRTDGVTFESHAIEAGPANAVLGIAYAVHADLIIAGARGRAAVELWILGSTSSALLRGAGCSVLLVPPPPIAERLRLIRHMTGTSVTRTPDQWSAELQAFVDRNRHRRTVLEIADRDLGAQVEESGLALVGATYDPRDERIALMFGGTPPQGAHLTHSVGHVRSVAVTSGPSDEDTALYIEGNGGSTLLMFLTDAPTASPSVGS